MELNDLFFKKDFSDPTGSLKRNSNHRAAVLDFKDFFILFLESIQIDSSS